MSFQIKRFKYTSLIAIIPSLALLIGLVIGISKNTASPFSDSANNSFSTSAYTNGSSSLPPGFYGQDIQEIPGADWSKAGGDNIALLHPENVRYPGSIAHLWDWHTGDLFPQYASAATAHGADTLEDLKVLVNKTHADPIYTLNIETAANTNGNPGLQSEQKRINDQIAMLKHAASIGLPVDEIELGNEVYQKPSSANPFAQYDSQLFPTGKAYALSMNRWIKAIKAVFPSAHFAASGFTSYEINDVGGTACYSIDDANQRLECWNEGLRENLIGSDQVVLHNYGGAYLNGYSTVEQYNSLKNGGVVNMLASPYAAYGLLSTVFHTDFQTMRWGQVYSQLLITEHNLSDYQYQAASGSWAHGLFTAEQSLLYLQNNAIKKTDQFTFWGDANFGTMFNNIYDYTTFTSRTGVHINTNPHSLTATGITQAVIGQSAADATNFNEIQFTANPLLHPTTNALSSYPSLLGYRFTGTDHDQAVILNVSSTNATVHLTGFLAAYTKYQQYSANPALKYNGYQNTLSDNSDIIHSANIVIKPYAIMHLFATTQTNAISNKTSPITCDNGKVSLGAECSNGFVCEASGGAGSCQGGCLRLPGGKCNGHQICSTSGQCM